MRHQVERLKHVALRQGVKPARALTATLVAIGMMVTGSVVLGSSTANADDGHNNGAICTSTTEPLGDQTSGSGNDEGIATFVGGDMYVGGKKSGITSANNNNAPEGSYAVEAEGLTAVNGKLLLHPMKQAWNIWNKNGLFNRSRGFRWGIVGFGSQFRPEDGSTVLSVGGNSTNSELNWFGGAQGWTDNDKQGSSWLGTGAGNSATGETNDHNFNANIVPYRTTVQSRNNWNNGEQYSVYAMGGKGKVNWNGSKTVISGVKNPSTGSDYTYSDYKNYVATLSGKLAKISSSNTVTKGNEDNYTGSRYSYGYNTYEYNVYRFDIQNNSPQTEITLTGNGKDELQVFNLDASMLNSISDAGVVFNFKNISDNASVAVNINGNGNDVKFRNGWQFKWNDVDISDGYVMMNSTGENRYNNTHGQEYVKRASQLMWNFYNTNSLTILGGKGWGHINTGWYKNQNHGDKNDWYNVKVTDDPSAAWMGSVMVTGNDSGAAGNFQSHVSTNGRVWTTGDFEMYNKDVVTAGNANFVNSEGKYSTSAVDMDQERHNLSWYGQMTTSCSTIQWSKVDADGNALGGTTWLVYGTKNDAVAASATPLTTIADNGWNDGDDADGQFSLAGLAPNATYYLRELAAASHYTKNTNIYRIDTAEGGTSSTTISKVYDTDGVEITVDNKKLLNNQGAIINETAGAELAWSKVDGTDNDVALAGSEWLLTRTDTDPPQQSWTITDNTTTPTSVALSDASGNSIGDLTLDKSGDTVQVTVTVAPSDASQEVKWTGTQGYEQVARISSDEGSGTFNIIAVGKGRTSFAVCSTSDSSVCATLNVEVSSDSVISLTLYKAGDTSKTSLVNQNVSLKYNGTLQLAAEVQPVNTVKTWESSNPNVATVSNDGLVTAVSAGNTDITVKAGNLSRTVHITVKPKSTVVYYYRTDGTPQIHYAVGDVWNTMNVNDDPAMTSVSGCNNWYSYEIANPDSKEVKVTFHVGNNWDNNGGPKNSYASDGYVEAMTVKNGTRKLSVPDVYDCNVTTAAARNISAHVYSAVLKSGIAVDDVAANMVKPIAESASAAGTLPDLDPGVGKFRVSLSNGTYTLKETKAPAGYELSTNSTKEYTIVVRDGQIVTNESILPTGNKIPNNRKSGTVVWNKKDTGDDGSSGTGDDSLLGDTKWTLTQTRAWNTEKASMVEVSGDNYVHTLIDNGGEGVYADKDSAAGQFKFVGLPWGVYTLKEQPRDGFATNDTTYTFTIDANSVDGEIHLTVVGGSGATAETVYNIRKTGSVTWLKVSKGTSRLLSGSQWTLKRVRMWNGTSFVSMSSAEVWNITDCVDATCTPTSTGDPYDTDNAAGKFALSGLKWGEYELVETVAPDGFNLDTTVHKFTIGPNDSSVTLSVALGDIENVPGVVLPSTGGEGVNKMYTAGFLAVAIAVAGLALSLRRRQS